MTFRDDRKDIPWVPCPRCGGAGPQLNREESEMAHSPKFDSCYFCGDTGLNNRSFGLYGG